jgi:tetratricopeptide (TPR) repeat protein
MLVEESAVSEVEPENGSITIEYNKSDLVGCIEKLLPILLNKNDEYTYTLFSRLFDIVLKTEVKKAKPNWQLVNDYCNLVKPEILKLDCRTIEVVRKGKKRAMELASDKEKWFAYQSKALFQLGKFQESCDLSKVALETFSKFHYSNDIWFARRIALAKRNLGAVTDAIKELEDILKKKKEWFIQKELAELYFEMGEIDKAFKQSMAALNNFGDLEYKVELLFLMGELLKAKGETDVAFKHYSLARLIRIKMEWKVNDKLLVALGEMKKENLSIDVLIPLRDELKRYWQGLGKL